MDEATAARAARATVGRAIRAARWRRAHPDRSPVALAPAVITLPERRGHVQPRVVAGALVALAAVLLVVLLPGRPQTPPPAAAPEEQRTPTATLAPTGGRGRASGTVAPVVVVPAVSEPPSPPPASQEPPQPAASAAPARSVPPGGVPGGVPGGAPGGVVGGVPGGSGTGTPVPSPTPSLNILPVTPPPLPLGGNRFFFRVIDQDTRVPVAYVCVIYGTLYCGPSDAHTNVLGYYWLDVSPNASRWSFAFDHPDYWLTTFIGTYTPGMGTTPTTVYLRHR